MTLLNDFKIAVASGKADKDRVTLGGAGGFHGGKAGVAQSFTVYVRDAYDNPVASNPDADGMAMPVYSDESLLTKITECELTETPGEVGQLTATYTITDTGTYWIGATARRAHRCGAVQAGDCPRRGARDHLGDCLLVADADRRGV